MTRYMIFSVQDAEHLLPHKPPGLIEAVKALFGVAYGASSITITIGAQSKVEMEVHYPSPDRVMLEDMARKVSP